jgi:peptidylprolyl isomerase
MAWLEDGTLIDSSIYSEPVIFTAGARTVMQGLEALVIGMRVGESKTEKFSPDSIYGPYRPELACEVSRSWLRAQDVEPLIGLGLEVRKTDGTLVSMHVTGLDSDRVTLDANHQLAGKNLIVQLDLLEIVDRGGLDLRVTPTPAA